MKIKSYYSRSVEDAIAAARQELGPEAMLVNSRRSQPESRHMGEYEVVFVVDAPPGAEELDPTSPASFDRPVPERFATDVTELRRELEAMRRAITRSAYAPEPWRGASPDAAQAYAALTAADLSPELARAIVDGAEGRRAANHALMTRPDPVGFQRALTEELRSRILTEPTLGRSDARPHIVALVGPPGAGKTTTLVKLAVNYGLAARRPTLLLSMDTYRVAAADQLRSYAAILGVGFQVCETVAALGQALEEHRGKELILVDTPGLGLNDLDIGAPLAQFLTTRQDIDTQLVLPGSMKPFDLARVADAYEAFHPRRLIFTRIDETGSFGPIVNEIVRAARPASFLATGQRIPEDLETATPDRIAGLVLSAHAAGLSAVA
jgi:flagellar biosynthesis protein FlhF